MSIRNYFRPSSEQTQLWYLTRQMSYDGSFFTATTCRLEAFWALSQTNDSPSPPPIPLYIRGSLEYNSFRKTRPRQLPFSVRFFTLPRKSRLQMLCCKIFVLKYFRRTSTLRKFSTRKFFQRKFHITKISRFTVADLTHSWSRTYLGSQWVGKKYLPFGHALNFQEILGNRTRVISVKLWCHNV